MRNTKDSVEVLLQTMACLAKQLASIPPPLRAYFNGKKMWVATTKKVLQEVT
jgi:hypothetical protein